MGSVPPHLQMVESFPVPEIGEEVAVGRGGAGEYLVIELDGSTGPCWVCAPATERALDCVRAGRTSPWSVVHHSRTGTVDVYRTGADGSLRLSVLLCSQLPAAAPARAAA